MAELFLGADGGGAGSFGIRAGNTIFAKNVNCVCDPTTLRTAKRLRKTKKKKAAEEFPRRPFLILTSYFP
jgi:hypothetical protein